MLQSASKDRNEAWISFPVTFGLGCLPSHLSLTVGAHHCSWKGSCEAPLEDLWASLERVHTSRSSTGPGALNASWSGSWWVHYPGSNSLHFPKHTTSCGAFHDSWSVSWKCTAQFFNYVFVRVFRTFPLFLNFFLDVLD